MKTFISVPANNVFAWFRMRFLDTGFLFCLISLTQSANSLSICSCVTGRPAPSSRLRFAPPDVFLNYIFKILFNKLTNALIPSRASSNPGCIFCQRGTFLMRNLLNFCAPIQRLQLLSPRHCFGVVCGPFACLLRLGGAAVRLLHSRVHLHHCSVQLPHYFPCFVH